MKIHILMFNIAYKFHETGDLEKIKGDFEVMKE